MKINLGNGNRIIWLLMTAIIALVFMLKFGITGARTVLAIILIFFIPVYIILSKFELGIEERLIISIFLGVGGISTLVYFIGLITKFRIGILIVMALSIILTIIVLFKKKSIFRKN